MNLTLFFDHRFQRDASGSIFSLKGYHYEFFAAKYLQVFEHVRIVTRVFPAAEGQTGEPTEGPGVEVVSLGTWGGALSAWAAREVVHRAVREAIAGPDAILFISPSILGGMAYPLLRQARRAYGIEVVGDPYDAFAPGASRHPLRPLLRWASARALRRQCEAAAVVVYVTREALQRRYPCPGGMVGVSDVELPDGAYVAAPRAPKTMGRPIRLVFVGTLATLYKAPDAIVDAVALCAKAGLDVQAALVGDGQYRPMLEARAAESGVGDRVRLLGSLPAGAAVRAQLDESDIFVLPSYQEGLPRAMAEAMARALPCIGSTVGGVPELLPAECMIPPGDARALAALVQAVAADPGRWARMSAENLARARDYHRDMLAGKRLEYYQRLRDCTGDRRLPSTTTP
jgi:glycosyltransferase involved in cell wall biosynthesis